MLMISGNLPQAAHQAQDGQFTGADQLS